MIVAVIPAFFRPPIPSHSTQKKCPSSEVKAVMESPLTLSPGLVEELWPHSARRAGAAVRVAHTPSSFTVNDGG